MQKPARSPWPKGARCAVMGKRHREVWWATGREIAEHWIERETGRRPR